MARIEGLTAHRLRHTFVTSLVRAGTAVLDRLWEHSPERGRLSYERARALLKEATLPESTR